MFRVALFGTRRRRGGAYAPYKRFGPGPKTLAQGGFTSPEHVKSPTGPAALCAVGMGDIVEAYLMEQIEV